MISVFSAMNKVFDDMWLMQEKYENDIERIKKEWVESAKYPRKKKKKVRKELQLDYDFAQFALDHLNMGWIG